MCKCQSKYVSSLFAVLLCLVSSAGAFGQLAGTGSIVGTVTDPSGAAVAGAAVTLTDTATNADRTAVTNDSGRYVFSSIQPGSYNLKVSKDGFRVAKITKQTVSVGSSLELNFALEIGASSQTVEVVATN